MTQQEFEELVSLATNLIVRATLCRQSEAAADMAAMQAHLKEVYSIIDSIDLQGDAIRDNITRILPD